MAGLRSVTRRVVSRTKRLWERAKREHSTPREVGWSVGLGVFTGCTPFIGLHMWIALGLASLFRLNRLWAFLGSRVSSNVIFVWIAFAEIESAHRLRTGAWMPVAPQELLAQGWDLAVDWFVGAALVGSVLAVLVGLLAYVAAREWTSARTPAEPLPRSSESPPSAPPAPPA